MATAGLLTTTMIVPAPKTTGLQGLLQLLFGCCCFTELHGAYSDPRAVLPGQPSVEGDVLAVAIQRRVATVVQRRSAIQREAAEGGVDLKRPLNRIVHALVHPDESLTLL